MCNKTNKRMKIQSNKSLEKTMHNLRKRMCTKRIVSPTMRIHAQQGTDNLHSILHLHSRASHTARQMISFQECPHKTIHWKKPRSSQ